ncbi:MULTISPECIES: hypothetical protein [Clostridium]|uniref:Uncharacterized protein n=1 Tax=Clostridium aquiflavi TaxID=3073603 RepID=A0ABU1EDX7_9CLOT|nr:MULTISPECIES: hypothetical protein [unclassified Clostridium]MDR5586352.1 hypothetical protein [Clostridium sp. 5N-1]
MKFITLTSSYKTEWESLISEFEENGEKIIATARQNNIVKNIKGWKLITVLLCFFN